VVDTHPQVHVLALSPGDPPHDRIILSVDAGAVGYITRDADPEEFSAAIQQVHASEKWLPVDTTYEVLQDSVSELAVTSEERRNRLGQSVLGIIPLTGLVAVLTAYLWRQYWGDIGVRVVDLGIDPTTRMIDVIIVFLMIIGIFGPLLFVKAWVGSIGAWIEKKQPRLARSVAKACRRRLGRLLLNQWVARVLLGLLLVAILLLLSQILPLTLILFLGPVVGVILLANLFDLDDELPAILHLPHLESKRVLGFFGLVVIVFLLSLGVEVMLMGPDL